MPLAVFSHVEAGVIPEDDYLPHPSFFSYCQSLLSCHRNDTRVLRISSNNFMGGQAPTESSYFLSSYTMTWDWATWRRCWQSYAIDMKLWPQIRASDQLANAFRNQNELAYWSGMG